MPGQNSPLKRAEIIAERVAREMGYELVDVEMLKEPTGRFLRFYVDREGGITLDELESYHRAIHPMMDDVDYDYMEVSSPGVDRPLKKDRDFERAIGQEVEVHLFRAVDGVKLITGNLADFSRDEIVLDTPSGEKRLSRKACALVKPVVDMEGVENVDLSE